MKYVGRFEFGEIVHIGMNHVVQLLAFSIDGGKGWAFCRSGVTSDG